MVSEEPWRPGIAKKAESAIAQERRAYRKLLVDAEQRIDSGGTCLWHVDRELAETTPASQAAFVWAVEHVQRLSFAMDDAAEALEALFRHGRLLWVPAMALTRQILEAALQTCWLLDQARSPEERMARALALRPGYIDETIKLLRRFGASEEAAEKERVRWDLWGLMRRDGVQVTERLEKGKPTGEVGRVDFKGKSASPRLNMTQLLDTYFPTTDRALYGLLSGAAHVKGWLLEGAGDDIDESIQSIVLSLLQVSEVYAATWCGYFGLDVGPYRRATGMRRMAMVRTGGQHSGPKPGTETAFGVRERRLIGD